MADLALSIFVFVVCLAWVTWPLLRRPGRDELPDPEHTVDLTPRGWRL